MNDRALSIANRPIYQPSPENKKILDRAMASFNVDRNLIKRKIRQGEKATKQWRETVRRAITPLTGRR